MKLTDWFLLFIAGIVVWAIGAKLEWEWLMLPGMTVAVGIFVYHPVILILDAFKR